MFSLFSRRRARHTGEIEMRVQGDIEAQGADPPPARQQRGDQVPLYLPQAREVQERRARERGVRSLAFPPHVPPPIAEPEPAEFIARDPAQLRRPGTSVTALPAVALTAVVGALQSGHTDRQARHAVRQKRRLKRERDEQAALFGPLASTFGTGLTASPPLDQGDAPRTTTLSGLGSGAGQAANASDKEEDSQGVRYDVLLSWLDRAHEVRTPSPAKGKMSYEDAGQADAEGQSMVVTSLQSYVNLKRNSLLLRAPDEVMFERQPGPTPTHALAFSLDSAAPWASINVFIRASRKHGNWPDPPRSPTGDGFFAQRGSQPDHLLGYHVFSTRLRRGFERQVFVPLALQLEHYAPPSQNATPTAEGKPDNDGPEAKLEQEGRDLASPDGLEFEPVLSSQVTGSPPTSPRRAGAEVSEAVDQVPVDLVKAVKAARETLKMCIVVEALGPDGRPLSPVNLQTTYLRLHSMPSDDSRQWSLGIEGQEVEVHNHRFQLKELYGLSTLPPAAPVHAPADDDDDDEAAPPMTHEGTNAPAGGECLICLSERPTTLLLPCTHSLCRACAIALRASTTRARQSQARSGRKMRTKYTCPVCRTQLRALLSLAPAEP